MRTTSGKSTGEFIVDFRVGGRTEVMGGKTGGERWRDVEEAETREGCEKAEWKRGAWKGAERTIRSSEGQRGADKKREAGKRGRRKKGNVASKRIRMRRVEAEALACFTSKAPNSSLILSFMVRTVDYLCWVGLISMINWRPKKLISRLHSFSMKQMRAERRRWRWSGLSDRKCNNTALILQARYMSSGSHCHSIYLIMH